MKPTPDIFFVASTTASAGWCVYRKSEDQNPRQGDRWWVRLIPQQGGILSERITIPKSCVKLRTRQLHIAARAAAVFNTAESLHADCLIAAKAQRDYAFSLMKDIYDTP